MSDLDGKPEFGKWQPIETAPRDGTWILVYVTDLNAGIDIVQWDSGDWNDQYFQGYDVSESADPTHWMPLPEPPCT